MERDALIIRIAKTGENLGMSAFYSGPSADITPYTEIPYPEKEISAICETIDSILSRIHEPAEPQEAYLQQLTDAGRRLFETLFSQPVKDCVRRSRIDYLVLSVDEELMRMPWELMYDGREFLCLRFALSRSVGAHEFKGVFYQPAAKQLKAMVLAPASAYIGMAYNEGVAVINEFYTKRGKIKASFQMMDVGLKFLNDNFKGHDIVHFVGHAEYDQFDSSKNGWVFSDGIFSADEIRSLGRSGRLPSFIFSDSYQYGRPETWQVKDSSRREAHDIARAFLSSGTEHFIGTFWKIPDEARVLFVKEFYNQAIMGEPVGEAMSLARAKLIQSYGKPSLVWAAWSLYGDPMMSIFERKIELSAPQPVAGAGGGLLAMPDFGRIRAPLIILAILMATFFVDRLFNRAYVAHEQTQIGKEIGSGLKYLVSIKESEKKMADALEKGDAALRGSGSLNIFWWKDVTVDAFQRLREKWAAKLAGAFGKSTSPITAELEQARLYNDIFIAEDLIYLDMLARLSIKTTLNFDGVAAKVRPVKDERARKLFVKAKISLARGNGKEALRFARAALNITRIRDDRRDEATVLGFLGALYQESGLRKEAVICMAENKNLLEKLRDAQGTADACFNVGLLLGRNPAIAKRNDIRYLDKALATYRSTADYYDTERSCLWLGYSYAARKEFDRAIKYLDAAAKISIRIDDAAEQALVYKAYGDIHAGNKEYVSAEIFYKQALAINRVPEKDEGILARLDSLYRLAFLNLNWHDRPGAANFFRRVVEYMDDPKARKIAARYKNIFKILGILSSFSVEDIPKETMRQLYMQMAVSSFNVGDHKTADRFIDLALSYKK